ncbi:MAG: hypothetical protein ACRYE9_01255 [Janthinobacterium lividum]
MLIYTKLMILISLSACVIKRTNYDLEINYNNGLCYGSIANKQYKCTVGQKGLSANKKEGDMTSPVGVFRLREAFYRADKFSEKPVTSTAIRELTPNDGVMM